MVTLKKPMLEEYLSQKNRLKNIYKKRIYSIDEIKRSYLMCKKHRMVCADLNYIEHLLILVFLVTGWNSISAFAFFWVLRCS